ncbi:XRE family transcriptional regulator [Streptomyces sp. NPDC058471]|uniref:XRE family transcriptional regulator n=1 Tax=Streptomyces sp. NPDC058471 TaxID=3346516 RepID=UPI00364FC8E3
MTTDNKLKVADWEDLSEELTFTDEEKRDIAQRTAELRAEVRSYRLAEVRKGRHITQAALANTLGVTQGRVSAIETGSITRTEVETLADYVAALGGELEIVARFGDKALPLS